MSKWPVDGGIETVTRTLANELVSRGYGVLVLYTCYNMPDDAPYVDNRIMTKQIPIEDSVNEQKTFIGRCVTKYRIHVVVNQCFPTWTAKILDGLEGDVKIIECLHMILFFPSRYKRLKWKGYDLKMRLCGPYLFRYLEKIRRCELLEREFPYVDKFVLLAKSYVDDYFKVRGHQYERGKLTYMNNPLAHISNITEDEFRKKQNLVLCVARLSEIEKRISFMIKIWAEIEKDSRFNDWAFDIVGEGPSLDSYKLMVDEMKLRRITFYGYQNPNNYYKRSKVFLMTSVAEGLPLTIVEAQQLGVVPVVLETFSGVHDLISDGVNGRIVKSERYFQKCLMDTMMNSDKREMMAYNGMESCKKFYAPYIVDQWEKLFDNL